jgi:urea transporter
MMCNNPIGGAIAIGAMFAANAWVACMACLGLLCSTVTAYLLGVNRAAWQGGLFGYNGLLIGAACGAFMAVSVTGCN